MKSIVGPYLWYPLSLSASIVAFSALLIAGAPLTLATFAPVGVVTIVILMLEARSPERPDWRPRARDVRTDAIFITLIQLILPRTLTAIGVFYAAGWTHAHAASAWWPHDWPLAGQVAAVVLIVDFLRYWLHRACHRFGFLWRLHEVHHSPGILYSLNVGRFHPLEKLLQWTLDTVPFLLLGVAPEVLAGYFLIYAVNGLFQHSNVRLRSAWLNYLVAGAELHRWHHARNPRRAVCNFSNTTALWDLVFGTWYLPRRQAVAAVGITDPGYPEDVLSQWLAPFRRRRTRRRPRSLPARFADLLIGLRLRIVLLIESGRIAAAARDPMRVQRALLTRIVKENRDTNFGRDHGFRDVTDYESYARQVPVRDFEGLRPYVDAAIGRGERALTIEQPVHYVRTSGTTGRAKDIPLTQTHLAALRRIHETAVAMQFRNCPEAFAGGILAIVSPACEGLLQSGEPFGSASGIVAGNTPAVVRDKFVVPAAVMSIEDCHVKYLLILRLALGRPDLSYIATANPGTLLMLGQLYRENETALIDDLRIGDFFLRQRVPPEVWTEVSSRLQPSPQRARELAGMRLRSREARIADLWPALQLVGTWTCASAGIALAALRRELPSRTRILDLGYIASEFRGTITLGRRAGSGFPTVHAHFFEFVERERWDRGEPVFLTLDRIRKGVDYYIFVTTPSGLYRYFINDLVRVRGFLHRMPLLMFVQKGKGVTNITGEKLYEAQVLDAVRATATEAGFTTRFVMMLADEQRRSYRLYLERAGGSALHPLEVARAVDMRLCELNVEYRAKRASGRLGPLTVVGLQSGTAEAYKRSCVEAGQREGQFKTVAICYCREFPFDLESRVDREAA
jgi:sterol desaturase/sphingolipid hydroxylase (fatty acid hydroxylase superfamily)